MRRFKKIFSTQEDNEYNSLENERNIKFRRRIEWTWHIELQYNNWYWWKYIIENDKLRWFMRTKNYYWKNNEYLYWSHWCNYWNYKDNYWMTEEFMKIFLVELKEAYLEEINNELEWLDRKKIVSYME